MSTAGLVPLAGEVRDYAWGRVGGIRTALGQPPGTGPEAELWLGAHAGAPSRALEATAAWTDLAVWEQCTGGSLPYLMKLLAAASPLSLQAHPSAEQARAGYAREEAAGVPLGAPERSYQDPHAKPEIIVAVEDGFDALCGFRPVEEVLALLDTLAGLLDDPAVGVWRDRVASAPGQGEVAGHTGSGVRAAVAWLLSGDPEVGRLVRALGEEDLDGLPERDADLVRLLTAHHPGDPGIAVALMLNRVRLAAGEALWLPAGNVHAYLSGLGVEVMGPSDNVLRGGLTGKHVDVPELLRVLDFTPGPPPRLAPVEVAPGARAYRPSTQASGADVPWQLLRVTGSADVATGSPSIALVLAGEFTLGAGEATLTLRRGDACFVDQAGPVRIEGAGDLYLATTTT
ncbi:mannose-6-phosphate isomerase, class I [Serinicoccus marinus]|uniref:mannose-6-phosphate isomerase, class I n=1 Tax=Serinicoccus marinus TaxID=247333 RepID=UPI00248FD14B|nr:mannose-6-phosphate isomerase, class I [Serinicoccus marinus]